MNKNLFKGILINGLLIFIVTAFLKYINEYNSISFLFGALSYSIYELIYTKFIRKK